MENKLENFRVYLTKGKVLYGVIYDPDTFKEICDEDIYTEELRQEACNTILTYKYYTDIVSNQKDVTNICLTPITDDFISWAESSKEENLQEALKEYILDIAPYLRTHLWHMNEFCVLAVDCLLPLFMQDAYDEETLKDICFNENFIAHLNKDLDKNFNFKKFKKLDLYTKSLDTAISVDDLIEYSNANGDIEDFDNWIKEFRMLDSRYEDLYFGNDVIFIPFQVINHVECIFGTDMSELAVDCTKYANDKFKFSEKTRRELNQEFKTNHVEFISYMIPASYFATYIINHRKHLIEEAEKYITGM